MADFNISALLSAKDLSFSSTFKEAQAKIKGLQDSMSKTATNFKAAGDKMTGTGTKLGLGLTAPLLLFGKQAVDTASDLAEVQNVVDTTFGDSADVIDKFSKEAKAKFGMSELSAKQFTGTIGAMLKSMDLAPAQVTEMSTSLAGLSGDMASFYNLDPSEAFEKLRAGISGEAEPLKQLGINMSQANLEAFALAQGMNKPVKAMSQAELATLRYNYIMKATKDSQGDFARTSDGAANQFRVLQLTMSELSATIGAILLPLVVSIVSKFKGLLDMFQNLDPNIQKTIVTFGLIAAAIGPVMIILGQMTSGFGSLISVFSSLMGPAGLVVGAIALVASGFVYAYKNSEDFRFFLENLIGTLSAMGGSFQEVFSGIMSLDFGKVSNGLSDIFSSLDLGQKSSDGVVPSILGMNGALNLVYTTIQSFGSGLLNNLGFDSLGAVIETVKGAFGNLAQTFNEIASNTAVQSTFSSISSVLGTIGGVVIGSAIKAFGALTEILKNIAGMSIVKFTFDMIAAAAGLLKSAIDFLMPIFETLFNVFIAIASNKVVIEIFNAIAIAVGICLAPIAALVAIFLSIVAAFEIASVVVSAFTAVMAIFNAVMAMNPFVLIIIGVVALIAAITLIVTHFETVKNAVMAFVAPIGNFFTQLGTQIGSVFSAIGKAIGDTFNAIITFLTPVFEMIGAIIQTYINIWLTIFNVMFTALSTAWNAVTGVVQFVLGVITAIIQGFVTIITPFFTLLVDVVKTIFIVGFTIISAFLQVVFAGIKALWGTLTAVFKVIFDKVVDVVKIAFGFIGTTAKIVWDGLTTVWNGLVSFFSPIFQTIGNVFGSVFNGIGSVASSVWNAISGAWGVASGFFSNLFNGIANIASNVWNGISNTISSVFNGVKWAWDGLSGFAGNVTNGIANAFGQVAQTIKNVINQPIGGINWALGVINKIPGVHVPEIPYLARGTDNWGGGFAVMNEYGKGELVNLPNGSQVIPHDISMKYAKESARVGGTESNRVEVYVTVENRGDVNIDSKKVADVIWREVDKNIEKNSFAKKGVFV